MTTTPRVSIVTVNYNGLAYTRALLQTLEKLTYPNVEVIVVDNASPREDASVLQTEFPWIRYVANPLNEGFAGGNNRGFEIATGDYYLMLNNDTEVPPGFLEPLVARFQSDPKIGVVCPKLLYFEQPDIIQYAGYTPIHPITGRGHGIGYLEKDKGQYNQACVTARAHGAAMMVSKVAFNKVGPMFEDYFLYYEEMDYNASITRAGFTTWYEPGSYVFHKESMSVGADSPMKTYYLSRNRLLYVRRQTPMPWLPLAVSYHLLVAVPKATLQLMLHGKWQHLKAYWRGLWWHWTSNPAEKF